MCDGIIEEIEASDRIIIISSQVRIRVQNFMNVHESRLIKCAHPQSLVSSVGRALDF